MSDPVRFYTDVHISMDAVKQIRNAGADVVRCQDIGLEEAADEEHLSYAATYGYVVITCDRDFPKLHWEWLSKGLEHSGIIYCRQPDLCTPAIIIQNALLVFEFVSAEEMKNELWQVQR